MKGAVAAGHEVTAKAAAHILQEGGNAFDAALAAMMVSGVAEFVLSSPGGGGFMMARIAGRNETVLYDFFARTPKCKRSAEEIDFHAVRADFGPATQEFHIGAGSTAMPGLIPGLFAMHRDLCSMPLPVLLEPAIIAARDGIVMNEFQAYLFSVIAPILENDSSPDAAALFSPGGHLLKKGELFRNSALADMLDNLARQGEMFFRRGDLARIILSQSAESGGHLTRQDLLDYRVRRRQPLKQRYRGHCLFLNPAPSAGGPLLGFALGALEKICRQRPPDMLDLVEIMSLTNRARMSRSSSLEGFASDSHIDRHLAHSMQHHPQNRGTTQISILDERGNAASVTVSNGEGNGLLLRGCGFMLNNMLGEEDLHDDGFHQWKTGQRLSSMMAPTLVQTGDNSLIALGSGGSNRIRSAILQVCVAIIDYGLDLVEAVQAPRLHKETDGRISFEDTPACLPFTCEQKAAFRQALPQAHAWPDLNMFFGGVHAVGKTADGFFSGQGDPRRSGCFISLEDSAKL